MSMNQTPPAELTALASDDRRQLEQASHRLAELEREIGQVIVGQRPTIRALLTAVLCEGHVLVVGVPGLAKTLLVKTLGEVLGWTFQRIQFTPDLMPADIVGMEWLHEDEPGARRMRFAPGPIFANIVLADEINRTPPRTQSALLEAMQERQVTSMGRRYELDPPFVVVATQNPIEQEGTYPLPEAQLDRFLFSLWMDYPQADEEETIVLSTTSPREHASASPLDRQTMRDYQALVRRVPVSRHIARYAVTLARATRPGSAESEAAGVGVQTYVQWGAGPRAGQAMVLAGKALALLDGEPTVRAEHIRRAAPWVLRHRVLPSYHAAGDGVTVERLIERLVEATPEPDYRSSSRSVDATHA